MEVMLTAVVLFSLFIASIIDIKTREVPDWLSYSLIASAFGLRTIDAIIKQSVEPLLTGLAGFAAFFVIGYILYRSAQWGGGDTKLLMGVGAAMGLPLTLNQIPTMFVFFINMIAAGAMIAIVVLLYLGIRERRKVKEEWKKQRQLYKNLEKKVFTGFFLLLAFTLILYVYVSPYALSIMVPLLLIPLMYVTIVLVKSIEKTAFIKTISPKELTEGDWLSEPATMGKTIIVDTKYCGVTKQDIKKLSELHAQGKIKKVIMRTGIPFVPSFFVGYLFTIIIGNWFALLV